MRVACAGRTDAGVHARGQVAHADVDATGGRALAGAAAPTRSVRRLGGVLPPDVRVHAVAAAPDGFDARWSALSRTYAYRVSATPPGGADPLLRRTSCSTPGHGGGALDLEAMNAAAAALLGEHDFASFCRRSRRAPARVRTLLDARAGAREPDTGPRGHAT